MRETEVGRNGGVLVSGGDVRTPETRVLSHAVSSDCFSILQVVKTRASGVRTSPPETKTPPFRSTSVSRVETLVLIQFLAFVLEPSLLRVLEQQLGTLISGGEARIGGGTEWRDLKPETRDPNPEAYDLRSETRNPRPET